MNLVIVDTTLYLLGIHLLRFIFPSLIQNSKVPQPWQTTTNSSNIRTLQLGQQKYDEAVLYHWIQKDKNYSNQNMPSFNQMKQIEGMVQVYYKLFVIMFTYLLFHISIYKKDSSDLFKGKWLY